MFNMGSSSAPPAPQKHPSLIASVQFLEARPSHPLEGQAYYDKATCQCFMYANGAWTAISSTSAINTCGVHYGPVSNTSYTPVQETRKPCAYCRTTLTVGLQCHNCGAPS